MGSTILFLKKTSHHYNKKMKKIKIKLLLVPLAFFTIFPVHALEDHESKYLIERQNIKVKFHPGHDVTEDEDNAALKKLEELISPAVGPVRIKDYSGKWKSNVETFLPEMGYGRADGLTSSIHPNTFVSTLKILNSFLGTKALNFKKVSHDEDFLMNTVGGDAHITVFFDIPVTAPASVSQVAALMVVEAQDTGPFSPKTMIISAIRGNQFFVISDRIENIDTTIPACTEIWNQSEKATNQARASIMASPLKDKARENLRKLEDLPFKKFQECFNKNAKLQKYFPLLLKRAQSIVNRLE
jgi:hypothetical protein